MRSSEEFEALVYEKAKELKKEKTKRKHNNSLLITCCVLFVLSYALSAVSMKVYEMRYGMYGVDTAGGDNEEYVGENADYAVSFAEPTNGFYDYVQTDDMAYYNNNDNGNNNNVRSAMTWYKEEADYLPKYAHAPDPMIIYLNSDDEVCRVLSQEDVQTVVTACDNMPWQNAGIENEQAESFELPDFEFTVRYYSCIEEEIYCKEYYINIYENRVYKSAAEEYYILGDEYHDKYYPSGECVLTDDFKDLIKRCVYKYEDQ